MKREPMVFAVAGMIFGFVLGYMAAGLRDRQEPRAAASRPGVPAMRPAEPSPAPSHGHATTPPDPDEVRTLEALAARNESNAQVRVQLGDLLMDHGQYENATKWYRDALGVQPDLVDARVDLGAALLNLAQPDEAIAEFDRALQKDPVHKKALFNKGLALMQTGRAGEAVAVWESLLKRYPGDPQLAGLKEQLEKIKAGRAGGVS